MEENTEQANFNQETVKRILKSGNKYAALQLTNSASVEDVERAYIYQVNKVSLGRSVIALEAQKAMKVLEKAYETLKDPESRKKYDILLNILPGNDYIQSPRCVKKEPVSKLFTIVSQFRRKLEDIQDFLVYLYHLFETLILIDLQLLRILKKGEDFLVYLYHKFKVGYVLSIVGLCLFIYIIIMLYIYTDTDDSCEDYYKTLGISKESHRSEIKRSYIILAKKLHPDRKDSKQNIEEFHKIVNAYEVLSNPEKRKEYNILCVHGIRMYTVGKEKDARALLDNVLKFGSPQPIKWRKNFKLLINSVQYYAREWKKCISNMFN